MDRKSKFASFVLSLTALVVLGIVTSYAPQGNFHRVEADKMSYSLSFSSTSNKLVAANSTQDILTSQGNPITFSYSGYSTVLGKWGNLAQNGYLANQTALSGLSSLSVTYGTSTGNLAIAYGWWDSTTSAIVYEVTDGLITSTSTTFTFDGYSPSFVKITASDLAQIASMTMNYYCEATEDPIAPFKSLVFTLTGSSYSVTDCATSATSIVIPSSYKGLPVTSIGANAFTSCTSLQSVSIPSTVTSIGASAFSSCSSLISLSIPASVTSIGTNAFYYANSLTTITVAPENPEYSSSDGMLLNKDGTVLICCPEGKNTATIPSSVTTIGSSAFYYCTLLTSVVIPSSVTSIGERAFYNCSKVTSFSIPSSVTTIGNQAFYSCTSLTSISLPSSVTSIGTSSFYYCIALTSVVLPNSLTSIPDGMFMQCTSLMYVTLPTSLTSIGVQAFFYCTNLRSIGLPSTLTSIGSSAFAYCGVMAHIGIPSSVTFIDSSAFGHCNILLIRCQTASKPAGWSSSWNSDTRPVTWSAPDRGPLSNGNYIATEIGWNATTASFSSWSSSTTLMDMPSSVSMFTVTGISSAFTGYSTVQYLRIPDSVTTIASNALQNMSALNTIIIGSGVTSIGSGAFTNSLPTNEYSAIYFKGTPSQWTSLGFTYFEANGYTMVFYSETEHLPDANYYWHYDVDGMTPLVWGA